MILSNTAKLKFLRKTSASKSPLANKQETVKLESCDLGKPETAKLTDGEKFESTTGVDDSVVDGSASVDSSFLTVTSSRKLRAQSFSSSTITSVPSTSDLGLGLSLGANTVSDVGDCGRKSSAGDQVEGQDVSQPGSLGFLSPLSANKRFMELISRTKPPLLGSANDNNQESNDSVLSGERLRAIPSKKQSSARKGKKTKNTNGPVSLAILTENGIQIKVRDPSFNVEGGYSGSGSSPVAGHIDGYDNTSDWGSEESDKGSTNDDSCFETTSLISCVTCLSETTSNSSASTMSSTVSTQRSSSNNFSHHYPHTFSSKTKPHSYSSVNGQLPTNSVIPYSRILNARYLLSENEEGRDEDKEREEDLNDTKFTDFNNVSDISTLIPPNLPQNHHLVELTFAKPTRHDVKPKSLTLLIKYNKTEDHGTADSVVEEILRRSYRSSKRHRTILVIVNPFGGKRNAKKIFKRKARPLLMASGFDFDVTYTKYPGHAIKIARTMDISRYDTIACASGDGIPHEVINGLYRRTDRVDAFNKLAITQIPCGSGNAMSVSCHWTNNPSYATLSLIKSVEKRIDVMCCSQESYLSDSSYPKLSFLSQTYGIIAESDINTEFIRWMGPARFELGVAYNILQKKKYPCDIYVKYFAKTKNELKSLYLKHKSEQEMIDAELMHRVESVEIINPEETSGQDGSVSSKKSQKYGGNTNNNNNNGTYTGTTCSTSDIDNYVTEESFKIKYPLEDGVPSDWERIDEGITGNLGIFYTGKMPYVAADTKFFPAAAPSDGVIDMVIIDSRTPFTRMVPILLALDKGSHVLQPEVLHSKIFAYKIIPRGTETDVHNNNKNGEGKPQRQKKKTFNGLYSIDGEKFPLEPLQVEVMPKLLKTLLRDGRFVDTEFDSM